MGVLNLILRIVVGLTAFAIFCYCVEWVGGALHKAIRTRRTKRRILSLSKAQLLAITMHPENGLDKQDLDGLVQLAFESYPEGRKGKDAIVNRLAQHLN